MPYILSAAHATPSVRIHQNALGEMIAQRLLMRNSEVNSVEIAEVFGNSRIQERYFLMPIDWYFSRHAPTEQHEIFVKKGIPLLSECSLEALSKAHLHRDQISHVIFASTTGLSTPTLDAHLINSLGLSRNVTRLPMWGLGCGAGVSGLARAFDHCKAYPDAVVLFVAFEACTLHFAPNDVSKKNLITMSLFSDCCAAAVVVGDQVKHAAVHAPQMLATFSDLSPHTIDIAGWKISDQGFDLVLSPELPNLIQKEFQSILNRFIAQQGLGIQEIDHFLFHPGGARVLDALQDLLDLSKDDLRLSEGVLRDFGNTSSTSVLVVLERWLADPTSHRPGFGVLAGFGPGYSTELMLVKS